MANTNVLAGPRPRSLRLQANRGGHKRTCLWVLFLRQSAPQAGGPADLRRGHAAVADAGTWAPSHADIGGWRARRVRRSARNHAARITVTAGRGPQAQGRPEPQVSISGCFAVERRHGQRNHVAALFRSSGWRGHFLLERGKAVSNPAQFRAAVLATSLGDCRHGADRRNWVASPADRRADLGMGGAEGRWHADRLLRQCGFGAAGRCAGVAASYERARASRMAAQHTGRSQDRRARGPAAQRGPAAWQIRRLMGFNGEECVE